jgi:hypothetical protein
MSKSRTMSIIMEGCHIYTGQVLHCSLAHNVWELDYVFMSAHPASVV